MPCYRPLSAWCQPSTDADGKRTIVFSRDHLHHYDIAKALDLPCGQCIGCRLERSRRWAIRIMHESSLHSANSFLTLTYSDDKVPSSGSLRKEDFQLFMKRLRRGSATPLRYFHCGEYGERTSRPHYHVCLFGEDFASDRVHYRTTPQGDRLYNSPRLDEAWGHGHAVIGELTFESAAYVARYVLKKQTGSPESRKKRGLVPLDEHYQGRSPEYVTMSLKPGIGSGWFEKYGSEVYPSDSVVMRGKEMLPPPYYDKLLERVDPDLYVRVKRERAQQGEVQSQKEDSRSRRLLEREFVKSETIRQTLGRDAV
jgi:hypothetical protein